METDSQSNEIYPMPSFVTLRVNDPGVSGKWYEEALGFRHVFSIPGPAGRPMLVHVRWAKYADLLLQLQGEPDKGAAKGKGMSISFSVTDGSVDELAEKARRYGASILSEPKNQPWNARDFSVADPDGFVLTFTKGPIDDKLGMDDIVKRSAGE